MSFLVFIFLFTGKVFAKIILNQLKKATELNQQGWRFMQEGIILTIVIWIGVPIIYYPIMCSAFEARVKQQKIIHQKWIDTLMMKTRLAGIIVGVGAAFAIVPGAQIQSILITFILWAGLGVWYFSWSSRRLIFRLNIDYEIQ